MSLSLSSRLAFKAASFLAAAVVVVAAVLPILNLGAAVVA